jgi:O-antigen ligase
VVDGAPKVLLPLLALTLPLEFTQEYFPSHLVQVDRVVIGACLVTLGLQALLRTGRLDLPARRVWLPALLFTGYAAASAVVTGSSDGLKTVAAMVAYALLAVAVYNWCGSRAGQDRLWVWFAISVIAVSIVGLVEYMTGTYIWNPPDEGFWRINSTFHDPNIYARVLTIGITIGIVLASAGSSRWRPALIAAILIAAAALPFTFSRQGWVLGGVVLVPAVVFSRNRLVAVGLGAAAVAIFAGVVIFDPDVRLRLSVFERFLTTPHTPLFDSPLLAWINALPLDGTRHYLIAAGFQMFYDHPVFGVGFGNFPAAISGPYHEFILPGFATTESHTSFVTIIAELGLVGLALVGWWMFELARSILHVARSGSEIQPYVIAGALALLTIVLQSQLAGRLFTEPYAWLFAGAALATGAALRPPEPRLSA